MITIMYLNPISKGKGPTVSIEILVLVLALKVQTVTLISFYVGRPFSGRLDNSVRTARHIMP
jgi:hypothetical protein